MSDFDPANVKALVFDTFGTVVDWRGSIIAEGESYWRGRGVDIDWAAFADAWRGGYGPAMNRVRTGEAPWTNLDALHGQMLDELLIKFDVKLSEEDTAHLNNVWHRLTAWPDAVPALTRLKQRYVIGPMSNGNFALLTNMAKFAGLPWDCILSTEIVQHYKPDPETYLMACDLLSLQPSQVMMVAAHTNDLDAAKRLGLRTGYVHRALESGPGKERTRPVNDAYDVVVDDYADLAKAMGV